MISQMSKENFRATVKSPVNIPARSKPFIQLPQDDLKMPKIIKQPLK